jgi:hypothetical protein
MKPNFLKILTLSIVQFFILNSNGLFCQNVNYIVLKDDPSDLPKLRMMISPFYVTMSKLSFVEAGFGFGAQYDLNDKMGFSFYFHKPYTQSASLSFHKTVVDKPVVNIDDNTFRTPKFLDITYKISLIDTEKKGSTRVTLSSNSSTTTSIMAKATNRKRVIARSGLYYYNGFYNSWEHGEATGTDATYGFKIQAEDGTILQHSTHKVGLPFSSLAIYGGISMQKIVNVLLKVEKYGTRGQHILNDVYFDFLFAPLISTEELVYNNQSYNIVGRKDYMLQKNAIGWRLGWEMIRFRKSLDMGMKVEVGSRPGIDGLGLFWDNHFYMMINTMKKKRKSNE